MADDRSTVGLEWAPISDVRVRASYNRAVRAPNLQELYQPRHTALDSGGDLCVGDALSQAQCALLGVTAAQYAAGGPAASPAAQYNGFIGGNPNLQPEQLRGPADELGVHACIDLHEVGRHKLQLQAGLRQGIAERFCERG